MSADPEILARLDALAAELRALRAGGGMDRPSLIVTAAEAAELVKVGSRSAFQRWCERWRVPMVAKGRYARRAIEAGLERETRGGRRRVSRSELEAQS